MTDEVLRAFWPEGHHPRARARRAEAVLWSQKDAVLITYGDSLRDGVYKPLDLLRDFLNARMKGVVNGVHILPFFPFTSDDGFAVTDYRKVNPSLGDWPDITRIGEDFHLMSDLVLNHVSSQGTWFNAYRQGQEPLRQVLLRGLARRRPERRYPPAHDATVAGDRDGERHAPCLVHLQPRSG